jgi:hypothetical protein
MEPDLAAMVLDSLRITVTDLEAGGADPYDLAALRPTSLEAALAAVGQMATCPLAMTKHDQRGARQLSR